jgi:predicted  nucleic acid-binding Zn-ribbon protein
MAYAYFLSGISLSDMAKFSSRDIKDWLERETGSIFIPVHEKAQKLLNEMKRVLEYVTDVSKALLEKSRKEIEKRNMKTYGRARALNKLARLFLERTRQIKVPDEVSYDSFHDFVQETQRAFVVTEVDIKNWFPKISPFFIMDRRKFLGVFEKAKESLNELQGFLEKEYVKTKTLEETFQLIDKLLALEAQLADLEAQREKIEIEEASIEGKIAETQQKTTDLKNRESLTQLNQVSTETRELRRKLKHDLRHLRKPLIKFHRLVFRKGGLTPEKLEKLNHYIEGPFDAFVAEEAGYPMLKQILKKLAGSMSEGKLKLKHDRKRKADQAIDRILNENSLDALHKKCKETIIRKKQLSTSAETAKIKGNLLKLQEGLKELERKKKHAESEENATDRNLKETLEKIHNQKKEIEKNVFDFMGRRIIVE